MTGAPAERVPRRIEIAFAAIALAAGAFQCWRYRHFIYPDGIQYVDVARQFSANGLSGLLNGTWSPLYPALLAAAWWIDPVTPYSLYASVQAVNVVCFALAVAGMIALVRAVVAFRGAPSEPASTPRLGAAAVAICAYAGFMIIVAYVLNVRTMSPDMLVVAVLLTASGVILDAQRLDSPARWAAAGAILGVGYLAKTVMFPVALAYLAVAFVVQRARPRRGPLLAAATFFLIALPWLAALSSWAGRPTYGDTGNLMYAWWVNGTGSNMHWTGRSPGSGTPAHPVTQIFDAPDAFAFDRREAVTYPLFFDPTWWNAGITPALRFTDQRRALARTAGELFDIVAIGLAGIAIVVAGMIAASDVARSTSEAWRYRAIGLPALLAIALYMLVHVEGRLVAGQLQILLTVLLPAIVVRQRRFEKPVALFAVCGFVLAAVIREGPVAAGAARHTWRDWTQGTSRERWVAFEVAEGLRAAGLVPGDRIAVVGNTLDVSWAQLAGLTIRAEISADQLPAFLRAGRQRQAQALGALNRVGVRAIVAHSLDPVFSRGPWTRIGDTPFSVVRSEESGNLVPD